MWDDWNAIDAAQAEAERIMREALEPKTAEPSPPAPVEPRMTASPRVRGQRIVRGEPKWYAVGKYGQYVEIDGDGRWEELPAPLVDERRGTYLLAKSLRAAGEGGLLRLREILKGDNDGGD